ncbi:hypothetical protein Ciccas_008167 [Cichlidogyrus casuarinus]|uniref:Uncharacterized protein n=1 Tax=Cichlidogyrus casuarinus TaxID=1844966 RepID=A0ABD2Q0R5_9PLAT
MGEADHGQGVGSASNPPEVIKPRAKNTKEPVIVVSNTFLRQRENYAAYRITNFIRHMAERNKCKNENLSDTMEQEESAPHSLSVSPRRRYSNEIIAQLRLSDFP